MPVLVIHMLPRVLLLLLRVLLLLLLLLILLHLHVLRVLQALRLHFFLLVGPRRGAVGG